MTSPNPVPESDFPRDIVSVLWTGRLSCSQLAVHWISHSPPKPEALRKAEHAFWRQKLKENRAVRLFNGALAELKDFRFQNGRLFLTLAPTDYRAFLYSNFHRRVVAERFGRNFVNQGLGISALVRTRDGQIVLMKRSAEVGEYPNRLDVFGGHIDPGVHVREGRPDPCLAIREELREELNVHPAEMSRPVVRGLIRNTETTKPELIFSVSVSLNQEELSARARTAQDRFELTELLYIPDQKEALRTFLRRHFRDFSPSGFGSLLLKVV